MAKGGSRLRGASNGHKVEQGQRRRRGEVKQGQTQTGRGRGLGGVRREADEMLELQSCGWGAKGGTAAGWDLVQVFNEMGLAWRGSGLP